MSGQYSPGEGEGRRKGKREGQTWLGLALAWSRGLFGRSLLLGSLWAVLGIIGLVAVAVAVAVGGSVGAVFGGGGLQLLLDYGPVVSRVLCCFEVGLGGDRGPVADL